MNSRAAPLLLFLSLFLAGCLSFQITTDPPGADITFDGKNLGKSPCTGHETPKPPGHVYTITARMAGYEDAIASFPNSHMIQAIPSHVHIPMKPKQQPAGGASVAPIRRNMASAQNASGQNAPAILIHRVATVPARMSGGAEFDLEVEFSVTDPAMHTGSPRIEFTYRVLEGSNVVLNARPIWITAGNGQRMIRTEKGLRATSKKGEYAIEAIIKYKNTGANRSVRFTIE